MSTEPNRGISNLAKAIDKRIRQHSDAPLCLDFGTVKKNGSLITNTFPKEISKDDYTVLDGFEYDGKDSRVLVAWVEDDAVVIGKLADEEE